MWDAVPQEKRRGYDTEAMINEVVTEGHHTTVARTRRGVSPRTKRQKYGRLAGYRETWRMFWHLVGLPVTGVVRWRTFWFYWQGLTIER